MTDLSKLELALNEKDWAQLDFEFAAIAEAIREEVADGATPALIYDAVNARGSGFEGQAFAKLCRGAAEYQRWVQGQ